MGGPPRHTLRTLPLICVLALFVRLLVTRRSVHVPDHGDVDGSARRVPAWKISVRTALTSPDAGHSLDRLDRK
jgi:hypothetical protein